MGHESAGVVTAIGADVEGFEIGDKVALEVGLPCEKCELCISNRYNLCKGMRFRSSAKAFPHFQGTLQERINHPARWCYKLPESISLDLGAILEPLGVAIHASRRSQMQADATVVVFGAGAVGLLCAYMARQAGARMVVIADIDRGWVDFAVKFGFAHKSFVVPMKRGQTTEEKLTIAKATASNIGRVESGSDGAIREADLIFECTGVESCVQAGIYATKPGGRLMLVGMGVPVQTLPISAAALREVDICGVFRYADTYAEGITLVSEKKAGIPSLETLVTHRFRGLEKATEAFKMAGRTTDDDGKLVIKVVIEMDRGDEKAKL